MKYTYYYDKITKFYIRTVLLSEKRKLCHSSQPIDAIRCLLDLHKKFQINLSIFATWLEEIQ